MITGTDTEMLTADTEEFCNEISSMDQLLQKYFKKLGEALGFSTEESLSLFDIPSMLTPAFNYKGDATENILMRDIFIYSQCEMETFPTSKPHKCYDSQLSGKDRKNKMH